MVLMSCFGKHARTIATQMGANIQASNSWDPMWTNEDPKDAKDNDLMHTRGPLSRAAGCTLGNFHTISPSVPSWGSTTVKLIPWDFSRQLYLPTTPTSSLDLNVARTPYLPRPHPHLPWTWMLQEHLTAPLELCTCPYQQMLLSFKTRLRSTRTCFSWNGKLTRLWTALIHLSTNDDEWCFRMHQEKFKGCVERLPKWLTSKIESSPAMAVNSFHSWMNGFASSLIQGLSLISVIMERKE